MKKIEIGNVVRYYANSDKYNEVKIVVHELFTDDDGKKCIQGRRVDNGIEVWGYESDVTGVWE